MNRITDKHLNALCDRLNILTGSPMAAWSNGPDGRIVAGVGNFHISHAYGGVCLHRMANEHGGVTTPLSGGHIPKRQLFDLMHAFIAGIEL